MLYTHAYLYVHACNIIFYAAALCCPAGSIALPGAFFGPGEGAILANRFDCSGSEEHLVNCSFDPVASCSHDDDASVQCEGNST